jgi:hypothetical protein
LGEEEGVVSTSARAILRPLAYALLGALAVVALCAVGFWYLLHRYDPPASWRNPPLYSDAQEVRIQEFGKWGQRVPDDFNMYVVKVITYTVEATPDEVKEYYSSKLPWSGWESKNWARDLNDLDELIFEWSNGARSPSIYFIDIVTRRLDDKNTEVEVSSRMFPGY